MPKASVTMNDIRNFFGIELKAFRAEWSNLTDQDKADLRAGIGDGSLTY